MILTFMYIIMTEFKLTYLLEYSVIDNDIFWSIACLYLVSFLILLVFFIININAFCFILYFIDRYRFNDIVVVIFSKISLFSLFHHEIYVLDFKQINGQLWIDLWEETYTYSMRLINSYYIRKQFGKHSLFALPKYITAIIIFLIKWN